MKMDMLDGQEPEQDLQSEPMEAGEMAEMGEGMEMEPLEDDMNPKFLAEMKAKKDMEDEES